MIRFKFSQFIIFSFIPVKNPKKKQKTKTQHPKKKVSDYGFA